MATKKGKNTRVSKQAKKSKFQFTWWMGVVIVLVVAILGLAALRFSRASEKYLSYDVTYVQGHRCLWQDGKAFCDLGPSLATFSFTNKFNVTVYCGTFHTPIVPGDGKTYYGCLPK